MCGCAAAEQEALEETVLWETVFAEALVRIQQVKTILHFNKALWPSLALGQQECQQAAPSKQAQPLLEE